MRLRAWDGSEAGPGDAPVLVARSPRALSRILWRPGELGLARAFVSGDLDVDGDLTDGLRRFRAPPPARVSPARWRARPPGRPAAAAVTPQGPGLAPACAAGLRAPGPRPPAQPGPRPGGDRRPLRPARRVLPAHPGPQHGLLVRVTGPGRGHPGRRAARQAGADLPQARAWSPGQRLLDMGCGWGSLTVHAARDHRARVTAVTLSAEQGGYVRQRVRGPGPRRPGRGQDPGLPGPAGRPVTTRSRRWRWASTSAPRSYPRFCAALHRLLQPGRPGC